MSATKLKSLSLTERRKMETRKAIAHAACDLFVNEGFDNVTVESIAQESGVSLRTFYRYFTAKDDVLAPIIDDGMSIFAELIAERPEEEDLTTAVSRAFDELAPDKDDSDIRPMVGLIISVPALRARWLDGLRDAEEKLAPVIRKRSGGSMTELEARLTAASIVQALRLAFEDAATGESRKPVKAEIASALAYFREGGGF